MNADDWAELEYAWAEMGSGLPFRQVLFAQFCDMLTGTEAGRAALSKLNADAGL